MHVRKFTQGDVEQVVDMIYDVHGSEGTDLQPLSPDKIKHLILDAVAMPERYPCFVHDADGGELSGLFYGFVSESFYCDDVILSEMLFYIRPKHRSYLLARAYVSAVEDWCVANRVNKVMLGNELTHDPRIDKLYKAMGYQFGNTIHTRRL